MLRYASDIPDGNAIKQGKIGRVRAMFINSPIDCNNFTLLGIWKKKKKNQTNVKQKCGVASIKNHIRKIEKPLKLMQSYTSKVKRIKSLGANW